MKFLTFASHDNNSVSRLGLYIDDTVVDILEASGNNPHFKDMLTLIDSGLIGLQEAQKVADRLRLGEVLPKFKQYQFKDVKILAPIPRPRKNVFFLGLNYRSHVEQNALALGQPLEYPTVPLFFSKPATAVIGHGQEIEYDRRLTSKLDYEVELGVVISRKGKWISEEQASDYIFGFTILNDVSARDLQLRTSQFLYGKGQDTYCPMGPCIVTPDEIGNLQDLTLELHVNGECRQSEALGSMIFTPTRTISELSKGITLDPGDIIGLGTPGGCGYQMTPPMFLDDGDIVECHIDSIGTLRNPIKSLC